MALNWLAAFLRLIAMWIPNETNTLISIQQEHLLCTDLRHKVHQRMINYFIVEPSIRESIDQTFVLQ